jgi:cytoskeletal protein CcmA (bactofilin family)
MCSSDSQVIDSAKEKGFCMFNQRKGDGIHATAAGPEKNQSTFGSLASPINSGASYKASSPTHSIVDERLTMKGDLESDGDIHVKGRVVGNIRCKLLIIEVDALVEGGVNAEEVVVRGHAKGTVRADRVRLEKTAEVDSEIFQRTFSAEEGARIKGSLRSIDEMQGEPAKADARDGGRARADRKSKEEPFGAQTGAVEADAA